MAENVEDLLNCQVCMENYGISGLHVPRLLPCTHTVCEKCIKQLMKGNGVRCPECRSQHYTEHSVRSFPQNKYLLGLITVKNKPKLSHVCQKHGKELILFCTGCQVQICPVCLTKKHQGHVVIDIEEEKKNRKDPLIIKLNELVKELEQNRLKLIDGYRKIVMSNDDCIKKLEAERAKFMKIIELYDKLIKDTADEHLKMKKNIMTEIEVNDENTAQLKSIKQNIEDKTTTFDDIKSYVYMMNDDMKRIKDLSGIRTYRYAEYTEGKTGNQEIQKLLLGKLTQREVRVDLTSNTGILNPPVAAEPVQITSQPKPVASTSNPEYAGAIYICSLFNCMYCGNYPE